MEFDPLTGAPDSISARTGFLTGRNGYGKAVSAGLAASIPAGEQHRATKAFLLEHQRLFGYGPEVLDQARVKREFVTPHNSLKTVVWQQQVDGISVFGAVLISHTTRRGELVNLSSRFLPAPEVAAERGTPGRAALIANPEISARQAVAIAAGNIGEAMSEEALQADARPSRLAVTTAERGERFTAAKLKGKAEVKLTWLPLAKGQLRLCWDVVLMSRARGEMYRVLVDAQTGQPWLRRCLTDSISDATLRVFTSDSPSPFSPGSSEPDTNQPPLVARDLLTFSALDTNASPAGWIDDGVNETRGNNVDAHTDWNADDQPDLPRPQGSPFRVFDFPLDLAQAPDSYSNAAVVQLFYWCNWMHDRLYQLGFTEAAGNFQQDNFGRGGVGGDAVLADAQDGSGVNNANFSTPPDGLPGRMQMFIFTGPNPPRDGDFDAEVILHEYTHGLSNRRVGGGIGISAVQTEGMGEGWSDFYSLSLLSEAGDDPDGVYATGAYVSYLLSGLEQNYYFGIRRYPYSTDLSKNPLTFKDIDDTQASLHPGVPRSPIVGNTAREVHNMGEVWCVTLWDARANLIHKYGWAAGNQLMLQLVTDGMNLAPPNPNFLQARDAILQADIVDNGGTNYDALWAAFIKRGMGASATCPSSSATVGVQEAFDFPNDLQVVLPGALDFSSPRGGPLYTECRVCWLQNKGYIPLAWTVRNSADWLTVSPTEGVLAPGASNAVTFCLTEAVNSLPGTNYATSVVFSNVTRGFSIPCDATLLITPPRIVFFPLDSDPGWPREGEWAFGTPAGLGGTVNGFPDPGGGATGTNVFGINLAGDYSVAVGDPSYLTAGPFDLSGYTGTQLQFRRWLNADYEPYVYATIDVSTDGTNWNEIWNNGTSEIADAAWTRVNYDISAYADNGTSVYVRWGHQVASELAFPYSGWNIDDVELVGNASQWLTVAIPPAANAGVGTLTSTVTASPPPATDLTVALTSADPSAVTVPASVTIPAGQSNAVFDLTIADELQGRETEAVQISATAPGFVTGTNIIEVSDSAAVTLHLSLPGTVSQAEGTIQAAAYIRDVQTNTLLVNLSSSDTTVLQVPDSVSIPIGETTAVFAATVVDDSLTNNEPRTAVVTAQTPGWITATSSVVVLPVGVGPVIVTQPTNLAVAVGGVASLSVVAEGTPPLNYQWSFDSTNVLGATGSVLVITNVQLADAGTYAVQVFNAFGAETSSNAVLSVGEAPVIAIQPTNQTVRPGRTATFSVGAVGTAPLAYQWSFWGTNLAGATTNSLVIANAQLTNAGSYAVRVSNAFGSANSSNAVLTVRVAPTIVIQPTNQAVAVGGIATLSVVAVGTLPLSYQWYRSFSQVVSYGTNSVLSVTNAQDGARYYVRVSNTYGSVKSATATLTVGQPPTILVQPTNQMVRAGGAAAFSVTTGGAVPQRFQWRFNGQNLAGATNNLLTITNVQSSDAGSYAVQVANAFGVTNSSNALLSIGVAPTIVMQPTDLAVAVGGVASLSVAAEGTEPLMYQWSFNGTNVLGATNSMLVLTNVQLADGGSYAVEVSNAFGTASSSNAVLSVGEAPTIVNQPLDQAVPLGSTATFEVIATGTAPLQYQWSFGGTNLVGATTNALGVTSGQWTDLVGATNRVLVITNVLLSDAGSYAVRVTNAFGVVTSSNALLTIGVAPAIVVQPTDLAVGVGGVASFSVVAEGTDPLGYQWNFNGTNVLEATNSVLVITNVQLADGGSYAVEVSNAFGTATSSNAVLSAGEAPVIVTQPLNQAVPLGGMAVFEVTATGTAPLDFQWSLEGADLPGATDSLLTVTNAQLSDAGNYAVRVANAFGVATSSNALLAIGVAPTVVMQPTNLSVAVGGMASFSVVAEGTDPLGYQWSFNGTNVLEATNSVLVITNVQLADGGSYGVEVSNEYGTTTSSNAVLSVGEVAVIVTQPRDQAVPVGGTASFEVAATGTAPLDYQWSLERTDLAGATNSLLTLTNAQLSDGGSYAVRVANAFGVATSSNALLTIGVAPAIVTQPTNLAVAVGGVATLSVVAEGTDPLGYQWSFDGTNVLGATNGVLVITNVQLADGGSYAVEVSNAFGTATSSNAVLSVGEAPVIATQPLDQAVPLGGTAAFEVEATGTGPLDYQWSLEGTDLVGATNGLLTITNAQLSDGGSYAVRVANAFGVVTSSNALLTIGEAPTIVMQPTDLAVAVGGAASLSVVAEGTDPLGYQWSFDGTNVLGATNGVLVITNVQLADGGSYAVEVSNAFGTATSSNAVLSVGEAPVIATQPLDQAVPLGGTAAFEVEATGTGPLDYQWSLEGTDLVGATNGLLTITNVQLSDGGSYAVRVANAFGAVTSSNALLTTGEEPTIVMQPTDLAVAVGGAASLSVVAEGTEPLMYQWSFNGTNVLEATNSILMITNVQLADGGSYAVEVSNAFGAATSSNVVLSVGEAPVIVVQPLDQAVPLGGMAVFEVMATGTAPLDYQWSLEGTNLPGATNSLLTLTNVQLSDGGSYAVRIANAFGVVTSSNALLTIGEGPTILTQPTDLAVAVGGVASLSVVAEGTEPLMYQWGFNGTNVLDATNSVLVVTNVQLADGGNYAVEVSNAFGTVTSSNAVLSVGEAPVIVAQPLDQAVPLGGEAAFKVEAMGMAPLDYQWSLEGTDLVGATNSLLTLTNVQLSDVGSYAVRVANAFGVVTSSNALLTIGGAPTIVMQPTDLAVAVGGVASLSVMAVGTEPLRYQWGFNGTNLLEATNSVLVITNVQLAEGGSYAVEVSNAFGTATSSNAVLSVGEAPVIVTQPLDQAVPVGGTASFEVAATGTTPLDYQWSLEGTNLPGATNSLLTITNAQLSDGGSYAVRVANAFGVATSSNALLTIGVAPTIVVQPTDLAVAVGDVAILSVAADGTEPLMYQWSLNGTNVLEGTSGELVITNVQLADGGSYAVEVSNAFGTATSSNAVLIVGEAPVIVAQPLEQVVPLGGTAAFEVEATGTAPLDYQWSLEGTDLMGATNSLLTITNVQLSDAGNYAVRVANVFGAATSSNALLTIGVAPTIVVQPTNLAVAVGGVALFSVVAEGTEPLNYQWSFNGTNVLEATNSVLMITNVQLADGGSYAVEVADVFGTATSSNAVLSVGEAPVIVAQPLNQAVLLGSTSVFEVMATGTAPLDYQWSLEGTDLSGATNSLLTITNVQLSDGGSYAVRVANAFGVVTSSNALLTVGTAPTIVAQPTDLAVAVGGVATLSVVAEGTEPLWYQWSFNGTNVLEATNSVLVITNVQMADGGSYAVEVSNAFGTETSSNAVLSVGEAPVIVAQPLDQAVPLGGEAAFKVEAMGTAPLDYQWSLEGTDLVGATNSLLTLTNVQLSDGGSYAMRVANAFGVATSSNALLTIGEAPAIVTQPTDLAVAVGGVASLSVVAEGTEPLRYQWSFNGTNVLEATNSVLVITNVQLADGGSYAVDVSNAFGTESSSNAVLSVGEAPVIVAQPLDRAVPLGGTAVFEVMATGTAPLDYQWSLEGTDLPGATNSLLTITNVQLSDAGSYAVRVANTFGVATSSNALLTIGEAPTIVVQPADLAVAVGGVASLSVVAEGAEPLMYQWSFNGTNVLEATNSVLVITNVQIADGGSYAVEVSNAFGTATSSNAVLSVGEAPVIVAQPLNQAVLLGSTSLFEVMATGTAPLDYQWSLEGTDLPGATNSLLRISNVQLSDAGSYAVRVANAFGVVTSSNALLTIGEAPTIVMQPTDLAVAVGGVASLSVAAEGTEPLMYQWSFNGTNVLEATNSILVITNVQLADGGSYAVEVSNGFGTESSSNAVLSVGEVPVIVVQPTNQTVRLGDMATFAVVAAGTPLDYQWSFGTTNLVGATNNVLGNTNGQWIDLVGETNRVLVITNVQLSDAGIYAVRVSNAFGVATSSNATLRVYDIDHFGWDPIPSPRFVNVPFPVRIQALDATNGLVNAFAGTVVLSSTNRIPVNPSVSDAFVLGNWTGSVTVSQPATNIVLVADDGFGHLGYANPITVIGLPLLSVVQSGASLLISWPAEASAFTLEGSVDLSSWSPEPGPVFLIGDQYVIRVPASAGKSFYRLRFIEP